VLYVFLEHHLSHGDYRRPDFDEDTHRGELRRTQPAARLRATHSATTSTGARKRRGQD
jgi:hypothetical protein